MTRYCDTWGAEAKISSTVGVCASLKLQVVRGWPEMYQILRVRVVAKHLEWKRLLLGMEGMRWGSGCRILGLGVRVWGRFCVFEWWNSVTAQLCVHPSPSRRFWLCVFWDHVLSCVLVRRKEPSLWDYKGVHLWCREFNKIMYRACWFAQFMASLPFFFLSRGLLWSPVKGLR